MRELFLPQNPMYIAPAMNVGQRKTAYDLALVEIDGVLVSADSRLPNDLVSEAIEAGRLPEFAEFGEVRREVILHGSRIDLMLSGPPGDLYLETKSVTLVEDETAIFPDAPTDRGRKHLVSLMKAIDDGHHAAVAFVVQRPDADRFSPHRFADPAFADTLRRAVKHGVQVFAYLCDVSLSEITISDHIPVILT
jgi:sugar fermentation stimulation protein A